MIPSASITEWSQECPWSTPAQVEQDLVLSRALVEIYSDDFLHERLLFRGGTALHKIVLQPAARYSEDLDFVQIHEEPIGETLDHLQLRLNPWLGEPRRKISPRGATLSYRFESEQPPVTPLKLKIEINTREHLRLHPIQETVFPVESRWFTGEANLPIYATTELLGTKLRALYQRRKGRDLFDLWHAHQVGVLDPSAVVEAFTHYMQAEDHTVSAEAFGENLAAKMAHPAFLNDTPPLLRAGIQFSPHDAYRWVTETMTPLLS